MRKGDYLFVYGTLRRGASADLSKNLSANFVGRDRINGLLYNLGWFPGVKTEAGSFDDKQPVVHGDIFLLGNDAVCKQLDGYEGYPSLYNRIETETASGRTVWVYTYNHEVVDQQKIECGDWLRRDDPRQNQKVRVV